VTDTHDLPDLTPGFHGVLQYDVDKLSKISPDQGLHNQNLKSLFDKWVSGESYRDRSTIMAVPAVSNRLCKDDKEIVPVPPRVVSSWLSLQTPANQKFTRIMVENCEVADAYNQTVQLILSDEELSSWKYLLTVETDNIPPPNGLLQIIEDMENTNFDAIGGLYWAKGPGGSPMCYDDQTEVLTQSGWKPFHDVTHDDPIATLTDSGYLEFNLPLQKQVFHYSGELIHWSGQSYDLRVTPDHNLYAKTAGGRYRLLSADDGEQHYKLYWKRDAYWRGIEQDWFHLPSDRSIRMDDWLEFLGYYISEGCCLKRKNRPNHKEIDIRQNCGDTYDKIASVSRRIGCTPWTGKDRVKLYKRDSHDIFDLLEPLGKSGSKHVPSYVFNLSPRQITIFLNALWAGDGSWRRYHQLGRWENYYTKSKHLADDVQELLLRVGLAGTIGSNRSNYVVSVSYRNLQPRAHKPSAREHYEGLVYDLTVPNHTMYVRRNGRAMWSGNCYGKPNEIPRSFRPWIPPPDEISECNGLGMGFTLFKIEMFKHIDPPWFRTIQEWVPGIGEKQMTQDMYFFNQAAKKGFRFGCTTNVRVGHLDGDGVVW
jgi:hypothetical protein